MVKIIAKEGRIKKERESRKDWIEISIRRNERTDMSYLDVSDQANFETYSFIFERCKWKRGVIYQTKRFYILDNKSIEGSHLPLRFSYHISFVDLPRWEYDGVLALSENEEEARETIFKDMALQIKRFGASDPQIEPEAVIYFEEGKERLEEILTTS